MPSELRILRFDLGEVGESLRSIGPRIGLDVPDGDFLSTTVSPGEQTPNTSFTVNGSLENITISNSMLAASLINYCKKVGIPIPRSGKKEIYVSSTFVELRIGNASEHKSQKNSNPVLI